MGHIIDNIDCLGICQLVSISVRHSSKKHAIRCRLCRLSFGLQWLMGRALFSLFVLATPREPFSSRVANSGFRILNFLLAFASAPYLSHLDFLAIPTTISCVLQLCLDS